MKKLLTILLFGSAFLTPFACNDKETPATETRSLKHKSVDYEGKIVHAWMELGTKLIKDNYLFGPPAARIHGYLGLTAWESVCNGIPGASSLAGQINDYPEAAGIDTNKEYEWGLVLCSAMRLVMPELVDNFSVAQSSEVSVLAELQESEMGVQNMKDAVKEDSKDMGVRIALKIIKRIKSDGRNVILNIVPVLPARDAEHPWYYDANTDPNHGPVEPIWSTVRTFVIDNSQSCEVAPPLAYSETPGNPFYQEALEVYNYPKTDDNKRLAFHWDDGPGRTAGAAGHWVNIAAQLLQRDNKNLAECAKTYALLGFALADAYSVSWYHKYKFNFLRPVTYIQEVFDSNWKPVIFTPPSPDYTAEASTTGGAAPVVLASLFSDTGFTDRTHLGSPLYTPAGGPLILPERSFTGLVQAGEEQSLSGIVGGIHFRRACELGLVSGRCVGNTVLSRLHFGF